MLATEPYGSWLSLSLALDVERKKRIFILHRDMSSQSRETKGIKKELNQISFSRNKLFSKKSVGKQRLADDTA